MPTQKYFAPHFDIAVCVLSRALLEQMQDFANFRFEKRQQKKVVLLILLQKLCKYNVVIVSIS